MAQIDFVTGFRIIVYQVYIKHDIRQPRFTEYNIKQSSVKFKFD